MENCKFRAKCKKVGTENCNRICYPYVFLHGIDGNSGFLATRNVPNKYSDNMFDNLPIEADNPQVYRAVKGYIENIIERVQGANRGIFFTGTTGTGKTTVAITILNEYLLARCIQHLSGVKKIETNPVLFMKMSEFQNVYNSQFRGGSDMQNKASNSYYNMKEQMMKVDLLVIDDIAMRGLPEGFMNEMYEIIDCRATEDMTTIFTSNVTYEELPEYIGERMASRIEGCCGKQVPMMGKDHRQGGLF